MRSTRFDTSNFAKNGKRPVAGPPYALSLTQYLTPRKAQKQSGLFAGKVYRETIFIALLSVFR